MNQYFWKSESISIHFNLFSFAGKQFLRTKILYIAGYTRATIIIARYHFCCQIWDKRYTLSARIMFRSSPRAKDCSEGVIHSHSIWIISVHRTFKVVEKKKITEEEFSFTKKKMEKITQFLIIIFKTWFLSFSSFFFF